MAKSIHQNRRIIIMIETKEFASEYLLHKAVVEWLQYQYPYVLFRSDYGGVKLPIGLAKKMKCLNPMRAYPDLFIIEPRGKYAGFHIEIKLKETKLLNKKGEPATPHIKEQNEYLRKLQARGFKADFGLGLDDIRGMVDIYLKQ